MSRPNQQPSNNDESKSMALQLNRTSSAPPQQVPSMNASMVPTTTTYTVGNATMGSTAMQQPFYPGSTVPHVGFQAMNPHQYMYNPQAYQYRSQGYTGAPVPRPAAPVVPKRHNPLVDVLKSKIKPKGNETTSSTVQTASVSNTVTTSTPSSTLSTSSVDTTTQSMNQAVSSSDKQQHAHNASAVSVPAKSTDAQASQASEIAQDNKASSHSTSAGDDKNETPEDMFVDNPEIISDAHDGTNGYIQYNIETLTNLRPEGLDDYWPKQLVKFRAVEDHQRSSHGGQKGNHNAKTSTGGNNWRVEGKKPSDPYQLLGRSSKAFTDRTKDSTAEGMIKTKVTNICNKLSRDSFNKLSEELYQMKIPSKDILEMVMNLIFDKALEFAGFQDLFADLARQLSSNSEALSDSFIVMTSNEKGEWYYDISGSKNLPAQEPHWEGPFNTEVDAKKRAMHKSNFRRLLLNRTQKEFNREGQYAELEKEEANERAELEKFRQGALGAPPAELKRQFETRQAERKNKQYKIRRRMLANIGFIGHLYMSGLLNELIVTICVKHLSPDQAAAEVDEESVEALCKLVTLVGKKYEKSLKNRAEDKKVLPMDDIMRVLQDLSKDSRLSKRMQFRCQDVIDARNNHWKMSEHHVAAAAKTLSRDEFRAQVAQEERKQQKEVRELQSKFDGDDSFNRSASGRYRRNMSQDIRELGVSRHAQGGKSSAAGRSGLGVPKFGPRTNLGAGKRSAAASPSTASPDKSSTPSRPSPETLERASQRIENTIKEYRELHQEEELIAGIKEAFETVPGCNFIVLLTAIRYVRQSKSDSDRDVVADTLQILAEKKMISGSDVIEGLRKYMPKFAADQTDAPKLDEYIAKLLRKLIISNVISIVDVARVCACQGGYCNSVGSLLIATLVGICANASEDAIGKIREYTTALDGACVGIASLYGPAQVDKVARKLHDSGFTADVSRDVSRFDNLKQFKRNFSFDVVDSDLHTDDIFLRLAFVQLIYNAGNEGMGMDDGSADLDWLGGKIDVIKSLFKNTSDEGVNGLLESLVQTVYSNAHTMYDDALKPIVSAAMLKWLITQKVVSQEKMNTWKQQWKPSIPFGWVHDVVTTLKL